MIRLLTPYAYRGQIIEAGDIIHLPPDLESKMIENENAEAYDPTEGTLAKDQFDDMTVEELKKLAVEMGLDSKGKKQELIDRITSAKVEA